MACTVSNNVFRGLTVEISIRPKRSKETFRNDVIIDRGGKMSENLLIEVFEE